MRSMFWFAAWAAFILGPGLGLRACAKDAQTIEVPINAAGEVRVSEILARLSRATGTKIDRPKRDLGLSTRGLARGLTRKLLSEALGPEIQISFEAGAMVLSIEGAALAPSRKTEWARRLGALAERAAEAAQKSERYGMRARPSYRPNDPERPTICMVHGLNSSSGGLVYMFPWLEEAGYGIVIYDYPFNRPLEESCARFARDWSAFRRQAGERRPWAIVAHSMGALLARSLVENDATWGKDVTSLVMIAPVNGGSNLARAQTVVQLLEDLKSMRDKNTARALKGLSDGLGEAARDMLPGSEFLRKLNARPRRAGVSYHIVAGDRGFLTRAERGRIEARIELVNRNLGVLGRLAKAATADLPELLDELTDGTGDGSVAVARTRLDGVSDHETIHANHAELIRAPLLFSEPGPVACMPFVLDRLAADRRKRDASAPSPNGR